MRQNSLRPYNCKVHEPRVSTVCHEDGNPTSSETDTSTETEPPTDHTDTTPRSAVATTRLAAVNTSAEDATHELRAGPDLVRAHPADEGVELLAVDSIVLAGPTDRERTATQHAVSEASHTDGAVTTVCGPVGAAPEPNANQQGDEDP